MAFRLKKVFLKHGKYAVTAMIAELKLNRNNPPGYPVTTTRQFFQLFQFFSEWLVNLKLTSFF